MELLINCDRLKKTYGPRTLFSGLSLALGDGQRTGLIGPNGSGKSTLLKILAGLESADEGEMVRRRNLSCRYVAQEDRFEPGATVSSVLEAAIAGEHLPDQKRWAAVSIMAGKIGFADRQQAADTLSGGWKKRLAIGEALITKPDLLLLDEPTNHLDLEGIDWLERTLEEMVLPFMVITHDRYFLESVTNRIIELNAAFPGGVFTIDGPYSQFLEKREEFLQAQRSEQSSVAGRVRREIEWLRRGAKARTTKAKGRIQEAQRLMGELAQLKTRNEAGKAISVDFASGGKQTRKLVAGVKLGYGYEDKDLFRGIDVTLSPGLKLGIVGPNGSGKSTLLRLLTGELAPRSGTIRVAEGTRIVYFRQQRERLDGAQTLRRALSPHGDQLMYRNKTIHVSGFAQQFLFRTEQLDMPVGQLSGGEQSRVLIAQLMLQPADVLVLDEPTNDLDIASLEVLEEALEEYPGAVVLVTHDRYMIERLCDELVGLDGLGGAGVYASLDQWEQARERAKEKATAAKQNSSDKTRGPTPRQKKKGLNWNEQKEYDAMEQTIVEVEQRVQALHQLMNNPALLADHEKLAEVCQEAHEAEERATGLYARWQELEARRE